MWIFSLLSAAVDHYTIIPHNFVYAWKKSVLRTTKMLIKLDFFLWFVSKMRWGRGRISNKNFVVSFLLHLLFGCYRNDSLLVCEIFHSQHNAKVNIRHFCACVCVWWMICVTIEEICKSIHTMPLCLHILGDKISIKLSSSFNAIILYSYDWHWLQKWQDEMCLMIRKEKEQKKRL